jgi:biopolymer transport protein ExbD
MDEQPFESLNVVPLVDVMLVLLTIVLMTASFIVTGRIPVSLPQASHSQVEKQENKTIDLTAAGDIYFDGGQLSKDEFDSRAKALPPQTSFLIRADRATPFQKFIDVADVLKRLKFSKVAVQTQSASR